MANNSSIQLRRKHMKMNETTKFSHVFELSLFICFGQLCSISPIHIRLLGMKVSKSKRSQRLFEYVIMGISIYCSN